VSPSKDNLCAIPTNIITGFLGAGKTSAILHLLRSKPADERWAVLVNEFGEIGVDGSLLEGRHSEEQQVYIREVPGGCMCCTSGLPMQIALNQLLTKSRPHRLLIEPTGLGHPMEILELLSVDYQGVLSVQKTLTLVDARKLEEPRYTDHQTFNQQIAIADVIVGNKQDLYQPNHEALLRDYAQSTALPNTEVVFTQQGRLSTELLQGATALSDQIHHKQHNHHSGSDNDLTNAAMPASGYIKAVNKGEGFHSIGWRFAATKTFNSSRLFAFLSGITAERMKAVFITEAGVFGYNLTSDALTEIELDDCIESRIEIIAEHILETWEEQLMSCIDPTDS
jgi:G3E family GTPase